MLKRILMLTVLAVVFAVSSNTPVQATPPGQVSDWQRFYHYPYVYYPHTFQKPQEYNSLYYRYPQSMRIPVYRKDWYNFYPTEKIWHSGNHYRLDVF